MTMATSMSMKMAMMAAIAMTTGVVMVVQVDLEEAVVVTSSKHMIPFRTGYATSSHCCSAMASTDK